MAATYLCDKCGNVADDPALCIVVMDDGPTLAGHALPSPAPDDLHLCRTCALAAWEHISAQPCPLAPAPGGA